MIFGCSFCGEVKEVEKISEKYVCEECFEKACLNNAALFGYKWWRKTLGSQDKYEDNIDKILKIKIEEIRYKFKDVQTQKDKLLENLRQEIKLRLQFYRKDEIFIALLAIKECIRRSLIMKTGNQDWLIISDASIVNLLMKFTSEICDFENHSICELENGYSNFVNMILLARRYNMIIENIGLMHGKDVQLKDICFEPVQTNETERYFDIYLENGLYEKPEDYKIRNEGLLKRLENENKTPDKILDGLSNLLNLEFGLIREKYQLLSVVLLRMEFPEEEDFYEFVDGKKGLFQDIPIFVMRKTMLQSICEKETMEALLNTFSINRNIVNDIETNELELFCFYEVDEFVVFGNFDFTQTISMFEKFLLSGHYIDFYKNNISQNKEIRKAQNTLSKYFSASVADYLLSCGYDLPMEIYSGIKIPRAEIEKIDVKGKNILINEQNEKMGDIDVLALNQEKKEILIFELKFYKPAMSMNDMLSRDRSLIESKNVFRHIKEREEAVRRNVDEVVNFILGERKTGYIAKSVLLTARANYYGIQEKEVEYLTWTQFLKKAKTKEL